MKWERTLRGAVVRGMPAFVSGGKEGALVGAAAVAGFPISLSLILTHKNRIDTQMQTALDLNKARPCFDDTCESDDVDNDCETPRD